MHIAAQIYELPGSSAFKIKRENINQCLGTLRIDIFERRINFVFELLCARITNCF